jgi:hypothetical protein
MEVEPEVDPASASNQTGSEARKKRETLAIETKEQYDELLSVVKGDGGRKATRSRRCVGRHPGLTVTDNRLFLEGREVIGQFEVGPCFVHSMSFPV